MKILAIVLQVLLGLQFLVLGLNGFLSFLPLPEEQHQFITILHDSGFMYVIKALEIVAGGLILSNRFVPLSLVLLGPLVVNIFFYHLLIDPNTPWFAGFFVLIPWLALLGIYRRSFECLFVAHAELNRPSA